MASGTAAIVIAATSIKSGSWLAVGLMAAGSLVDAAIQAKIGSERPSDDGFSAGSFEQKASKRDEVIREDVTPQRIVYGTVKVAGPMTFAEVTGDDNQFLHLVVPVAGHRIKKFKKFFLEDTEVSLDSDEFVRTDQFVKDDGTKTARIRTHRGFDDQSVDSKLKDEAPSVGDDFEGNGIAYMYGRFEWDRNIYSGVPQFSSLIDGKDDILDFRDNQRRFTKNAALCIADYMMLGPRRGIDLNPTDFNTDQIIAAANACDEKISLKSGGTENRYETNGTISLNQTPKSIIQKMLTAMAGRITYSAGEWFIFPAIFQNPTIELDEDDARGDITVSTQRPKRDSFNSVKGTYISPENDWAVNDFPPVEVQSYIDEDNGKVRSKEINLEFTTSPSMAQRIGRVLLERNRREITVEYPANLNALPVISASTVKVTNERFGWDKKVFRVTSWKFSVSEDDEQGPAIGIDLSLQETDSGVFDWSPNSDEKSVSSAPTTNLPPRTNVQKPTGLSLTSDDTTKIVQDDGTVVQRIKVEWTEPSDAFVKSGGQIEVQSKLSSESDSEFETQALVPGDTTSYLISNVQTGFEHDVRIRSINVRGQTSAFVRENNKLAPKKDVRPEDVSGLELSKQTADSAIELTWNPVGDNDLSHYVVKFDNQAVYTWDTATVIDNDMKRTEINIPPEVVGFGDWRFAVKAVDTTGNESTNAATVDLTINRMFTNRRSLIVGDSTFTVPDNVTELDVVLAGGGAGGGEGGEGGGGGGGGAGENVESVEPVNGGDSISVTIGSGGTGGSGGGSAGNAGNAGSDTEFGSLVTSGGGEPGNGGGSGGQGGGSGGRNNGTSGDFRNGGPGGSTAFGTGGAGGERKNDGGDGTGLGAGGGGGGDSTSGGGGNAGDGGDGTSGFVEVEW